ncbi:MAG TPA: DUF4157 domain-containing protein [Pyrinomonadaceae bacterium]|nr:DUF4157 domain-containing protein [Pyrinomonadaceae bacterium]
MIERAQHHSGSNSFASAPIFSGVLQRKCGCGNHTVAGGSCAECSKKKSGLQPKLAVGPRNDSYEQEADRVAGEVLSAPAHGPLSTGPARIQRYVRNESDNAGTVPDSVGEVLAGSGRPLDSVLREDMEQRFGHDFSRVRVHSGRTAEQSARELNALAYTVDHNIVFGAGQFNPDAHAGRKLIAHELTHVVQQTGGGGPGSGTGHLAAKTIQRAPMDLDDNLRLRHGNPLPYREATELNDCIRIMGEKNAAYCRREVLGEEDPTTTPFVPPSSTSKPATSGPSTSGPSTAPTPAQGSAGSSTSGSGKTGRVLRMEKLRDCAYTITYANQREVDCDTIWMQEKGTKPPSPLCGKAIVYDITAVTATGAKCPAKLEGLTLSENVKGDHGCTPPSFVWKAGSCVIGPGGKISNCTDTYSLCGLASALKGSCTEIVDQEMNVGTDLAEEHEITFDLKKSAADCKGKVTRN